MRVFARRRERRRKAREREILIKGLVGMMLVREMAPVLFEAFKAFKRRKA